jgi:hypothetical protein
MEWNWFSSLCVISFPWYYDIYITTGNLIRIHFISLLVGINTVWDNNEMIHPSIHQFIHQFIHQSIYSSINSSIYPSNINPCLVDFSWRNFGPILLSNLSVHQSINPSIHPCIHPFIHPSMHPSMHSSIHLRVHSFMCPEPCVDKF